MSQHIFLFESELQNVVAALSMSSIAEADLKRASNIDKDRQQNLGFRSTIIRTACRIRTGHAIFRS
jgi:hypothetical protein